MTLSEVGLILGMTLVTFAIRYPVLAMTAAYGCRRVGYRR